MPADDVRLSEAEYHAQTVARLYELALSAARERWPAGSHSLHQRMAETSLRAAHAMAYAGNFHARDDKVTPPSDAEMIATLRAEVETLQTLLREARDYLADDAPFDAWSWRDRVATALKETT